MFLYSPPSPFTHSDLQIGITQPSESEREGDCERDEHEPLTQGKLLFIVKEIDMEWDDDDGLPKIHSIRYLGDPGERAIIQPVPDPDGVVEREEGERHETWDKREVVRTMGPGVAKFGCIAYDPEEYEYRDKTEYRDDIVPERATVPLLFPQDVPASDDRTEEEVESEQEGIIGRKPRKCHSVSHGEWEMDEGEVEREEQGSASDKPPGDELFRDAGQEDHNTDYNQCPHDIVGNVPKRTTDIDRKYGGWMYPREEGESGKEAHDRIGSGDPECYREEEAGDKGYVVGWCDAEKPINNRLFCPRHRFV